MTTYAITDDGIVRRLADGALIPADERNTDYAAYLAWRAGGGEPEAPSTPAPSADDVRAECARRMRLLVGARDAQHLETIVSNAQREAVRLQAIRLGIPGVIAGRDWTAAEAARAAALYRADAAIEALRAASNALEAAPPDDYTADGHWPALG